MNRLAVYLLRALLVALVIVTFAVTAAVWLTQALRYVDIVVENGAPLHMFVWLALLTLPTFLALALPIALFVAVLFTYYRLQQDSELIAMRACGIGPLTLAKPALVLAGIAVAVGYGLSLWVQPMASRELLRLQYFVQSQFSAALLKEGTFNDLGNRMTVYVARRDANAELYGILIHDGRNAAKPITIRAARGQLVQGKDGPQVIVYDGVQQEYTLATHRLSALTFDSYAVSLDTLVPNMTGRLPLPRELDTFSLIAKLQKEPDAFQAGRLSSELHQRLTTPLMAMSFSLIATCTLLFGSFNRRGHAHRVILAVGLAAGLEAVALALGQSISRHNWAVFPLYVVAFTPIIAGGYLLWQTEAKSRL